MANLSLNLDFTDTQIQCTGEIIDSLKYQPKYSPGDIAKQHSEVLRILVSASRISTP